MEDGLVKVSAVDKCQHLSYDERGVCRVVACPSEATKFKPRLSPAGRLVLEVEGSDCVLGIEKQDQSKLLTCRQAYKKETQSWMFLLPHKHSIAQQLMNEAVANENELAGRHQLIMHFVQMGKTVEELTDIVNLLYGSISPLNTLVAGYEIAVERRQQILKLLAAGKSTKEARDILQLMYGTTSPIMISSRTEASIPDMEVTVQSPK